MIISFELFGVEHFGSAGAAHTPPAMGRRYTGMASTEIRFLAPFVY